MIKKYSLTNDKKNIDRHTVYRIIAEKDFNGIKKGTLGGYVESDNNLSHDGKCWIYDNAKVFGDACIHDNAKVCGNSQVYGNASIRGNAKVYGNVCIHDNAILYGNAEVYGNAILYGNAEVYGNAHVYENAKIYGNANVYGNAHVYENAKIYGNANVYGNGSVSQDMWINSASVCCSLEKNILESIRCQTGLGVFNNRVFAYKQTNKDLTSFYDKNFKYEIGKTIEVENPDMSNRPCSDGLHFSNMNYWNHIVGADTCYLVAEIDLDDVITVQQGKIRCKKAKILGVYSIQ